MAHSLPCLYCTLLVARLAIENLVLTVGQLHFRLQIIPPQSVFSKQNLFEVVHRPASLFSDWYLTSRCVKHCVSESSQLVFFSIQKLALCSPTRTHALIWVVASAQRE